MTCRAHEFDPRSGRSFRVVLPRDETSGTGTTSATTDTCHGYVATLVSNERVAEVVEFETTVPEPCGQMAPATTLADADGGTDVAVVFDGRPSGVPTAGNDAGTRVALPNLAAIVEMLPRGETIHPHRAR